MPLYEYECEKCGRSFEVRQSLGKDGTDLECPSCGNRGPRRVISSFNCSGSGDSGFLGGGSGCSTCSSGNCASCGM